MDSLNLAGAVLFTATAVILSLYLVSTFTIAKVGEWLAGPLAWIERRREAFYAWRERLQKKSLEKAETREAKRRAKAQVAAAKTAELEAKTLAKAEARAAKSETKRIRAKAASVDQAAVAADTPPWETAHEAAALADGEEPNPEYASIHEIPICPIEDLPPEPVPALVPDHRPAPAPTERKPMMFEMPSTEFLNEIPGRSAYDEQELKDTAVRIKSKFEEFNVLGNVVQINPGPVVTTFEFKPDAGIKYSRITNLTEDLCLGLQAESILIERIPGKPTVGIEVPNTKREVISLRQMLESEEFNAIAFAPDHRAGQGHQRAHPRGGARRHAAPADRRLDRLGQERNDQLDDHVDSLQGHARRSAHDHGGPQTRGTRHVRGHSALADAGDRGSQESHQRAEERRAGDGAPTAPAGGSGRAQHRSVQQEDPQAAGAAAQPV